MMFTQPAFWHRRTLCAMALWPVSLVYQSIATLHRWCRLRRRYWAAIPVISIGNITLGGAGKTPVVQFLAEHFANQGEQVAILSRGYGSNNNKPYQLTAQDTAATVGDEPLMLYHALAQHSVQVWVSPNRADAARRAEQAGATLLILDDGFQHHQLARNADIVVVDGTTGFGNGLCLPAGPLREPLRALKRAHFMIVLNSTESHPHYWQHTAYRAKTKLHAQDVAKLTGKNVVAFAGIAHPTHFFTALTNAGVTVVATQAFADHHAFTRNELKDLQALAAQHNAVLVTTSKDAARLPTTFPARPIRLELTGPDLMNICEDLHALLR